MIIHASSALDYYSEHIQLQYSKTFDDSQIFIHTDIAEIPKAHILQRWTKTARYVIPNNIRSKCAGSTQEFSKVYQQTQIYGKALEVARKGNYNFDTCEIVMYYLQKAERKVDELMRNQREQANEATNGTAGQGKEPIEMYSTTDTEGVSANKYGASGSCAGMSDEELMNIKAPPRPKVSGKLKQRRYMSFLDKMPKKKGTKTKGTVPVEKMKAGKQVKLIVKKAVNKSRAKPTSTKITPHCTKCRTAGHNKARCPEASGYDGDEEDRVQT